MLVVCVYIGIYIDRKEYVKIIKVLLIYISMIDKRNE